MKELDVLLEHFLAHDFDRVDDDWQAAFIRLLDCPDPVLLDLLTGRMPPPDALTGNVIERLRADS